MGLLTKGYLKELYDRLWLESLDHVLAQGFGFDSGIDDPNDDRFGITLLVRPDEKVIGRIQGFMDRVRAIEPNHHFYPESDMHVTVMSIISCYSGFSLKGIDEQEYIDLIAACIDGMESSKLQFRGVTLSPSCVLIQGFPLDNLLDKIRGKLRTAFGNAPLEQSLDKRYPLQTYHSTVIRFKEEVQKKGEILRLLEDFRDFDFGVSPIKEVELVFNDWYQRERFVKKLFVFGLK